MAQNEKIGVRDKILGRQAREVIANVLQFMQNEAERGTKIPLAAFRERVLAATGIGEKSYSRIQKESAAVKAGIQSTFKGRKKTRNRIAPKTDLNDGEIQIIRSIMHDIYVVEKSQPNLKMILERINTSGIDYEGSGTTFRKILKNMGFIWKRTTDGRNVLVESHDIRLKRIKYLKQLKIYLSENRPIIFTGKLCIYSNHTQGNSSTEDSKKLKGQKHRLIITHAGSKDGFIENSLLMFPSGSKNGDSHEDINHTNFMKWLQTQLIPNFPYNGVLVIDNAPYYNVVKNKDPTSGAKKQEMITWLAQRGIPHPTNITKPELYEIIKLRKCKYPPYVLDTEMCQHGFRVLRLPPNHPELNPIEKIFTQIKNYVADRNSSLKLDDVMALAKEKLDSITKEDWAKVCEDVDKTVDHYMEMEHLIDDAYEEFDFVDNTGDSDDEESEKEDEEEEEDDESQNMAGVIWL